MNIISTPMDTTLTTDDPENTAAGNPGNTSAAGSTEEMDELNKTLEMMLMNIACNPLDIVNEAFD